MGLARGTEADESRHEVRFISRRETTGSVISFSFVFLHRLPSCFVSRIFSRQEMFIFKADPDGETTSVRQIDEWIRRDEFIY